ncbi:Fanconi anemia protein FancD2 nuclease-domain-containing protein [Syncephalis fuscata]|nr:Fanconi anemia protein FancD2 nuclease-domain-containing protein [Syncephalis fuscata]
MAETKYANTESILKDKDYSFKALLVALNLTRQTTDTRSKQHTRTYFYVHPDPLLLRQLVVQYFAGITEDDAVEFIAQLNSYVEATCDDDEDISTKPIDASIDSVKLHELLVPIRTAITSEMPMDTNASYTMPLSEDSIIRLLLRINLLQPYLIDWLLETLLIDSSSSTEQQSMPDTTAKTTTSILPMDMAHLSGIVLRQLRWLENMVDLERLANKMAETLQMAPVTVQRDIITCIPEIFGSIVPQTLVDELLQLVHDHSDLTVAAVDTLGELDLSEDIRVIIQIRNGIDLRTLAGLRKRHPLNTTTTDTPTSHKTVSALVLLLLETIRHYLRRHGFIADAWLYVVQQTNEEQATLLDIIICYLLQSNRSKKIELLFRQSIINCVSSDNEGQFTSILSMADGLLHKLPSSLNDLNIISKAVISMYESLFDVADQYHRQEVVVNLVMHVVNYAAEVEQALLIIHHLCKTRPLLIRPFSVFIKSTLDHIDQFDISLVRFIYTSLCELVVVNALLSEMNMLIRKQLVSPVESYRYVGILGVIVLVDYLNRWAQLPDTASTSRQSESETTTAIEQHPWLKRAIVLLEHAINASRTLPKMQTHLYDELSILVLDQTLDHRLISWIYRRVAEQFPLQFMLSTLEVEQSQMSVASQRSLLSMYSPILQSEVWMNHDGETSDAVINIYLLSIESYRHQMKKSSFAPACALFNLLQCCVKRLNNNSLEEIDALLGCGLGLMDRSELMVIKDKMPQDDQSVAVLCLIYALNWVRELLNAYSDQVTLPETQLKCLLRLEDAILLEKIVVELIPTTHIPLQLVEAMMMTMSSMRYTQLKLSGTIETLLKSKDILRPLRMDVFKLLTHPLIVDQSMEMETTNNASGKSIIIENRLNLNGLNYLLDDLKIKLSKQDCFLSIITTTTANLIESNSKNETNEKNYDTIYRILVDLQRHMRTITGQLSQSITSSMDTDQQKSLASCLFKLLKIWQQILLYKEHLSAQALKSFLYESVAQFKTSKSISELVDDAFQWVLSLQSYAFNITTACELQQLLKLLSRLSQNSLTYKMPLSETANSHLKQAWPIEEDTIMHQSIGLLLQDQLQYHTDPTAILMNYATAAYPLLLDSTKAVDDSQMETDEYPLLTHSTFPLFYKTTFTVTIKLLTQFNPMSYDTDTQEEAIIHLNKLLTLWRKHADIMQHTTSRHLIRVTLQCSKQFMDQFIKCGLPVLDAQFRTFPDQVVAALKTMQQATRLLQVTN